MTEFESFDDLREKEPVFAAALEEAFQWVARLGPITLTLTEGGPQALLLVGALQLAARYPPTPTADKLREMAQRLGEQMAQSIPHECAWALRELVRRGEMPEYPQPKAAPVQPGAEERAAPTTGPDLRPLLLRAALSLEELTVSGEAAQLLRDGALNLAADREREEARMLAVLIRRTLGPDYFAAAASAPPSTPGDCGFCGAPVALPVPPAAEAAPPPVPTTENRAMNAGAPHGHPRGGPYPTGLDPHLAETIQWARGRIHEDGEPMDIAAYVVARLSAPDDLRLAFGYLLNAQSSRARVRLMKEQRAARAAASKATP